MDGNAVNGGGAMAGASDDEATPIDGGKRRRRSKPAFYVQDRGMTGTIRMFNADKGWGFIDGDSVGGDIFLHSKHFLGEVPSFWIGHKSSTKDRDKAMHGSGEAPVRV